MARRRKNRTHVAEPEDPSKFPPRSFVVKSGDVGRPIAHLIHDVRKVMSPNTAAKLRERKTNKLRDYVALSGPMHVSHLMVFSRSDTALNLRLGRLPRGPTVGFRVKSFTLATDIAHALKTPKSMTGAMFATAPLLVLNNFPSDRNEYKLLSTILHSMFPPINVSDLKIAHTRRVVLFNYNPDTDSVDFRHYAIDVKATDVTKGVRKIISAKDLPDLGQFADIADYITRETHAAESDVEDANPENKVELPQDYIGRNNKRSEQRAIKLTELGPRMDLGLIKIQDGLCSGEVLYHKYVQKSEGEVAELRARIAKRDQERKARRAQQEANVARKKAEKEARKAKRKQEGRSELSSDSESEDDDDEGAAGQLGMYSDDEEEYHAMDDMGDDVDLDEASDQEEFGEANGSDDDEDSDLEEQAQQQRPPTKKHKSGASKPARPPKKVRKSAPKGGKRR
ncbi:Brix domain-domain-containing protein [Catenaria anguillulae PL171]|uniref:Brix domain-domain-containing protein n=1 Tax=Catenaria anguillulae PL171 TaxID=765915 RepID=A0A1Y2HRI8_9FUNG|nr:Brix domain-domain-containing protein [Catenaria anguillulae PL171]